MAFNIQNFSAHLQDKGTQTNAHYDVQIIPPVVLIATLPLVNGQELTSFTNFTRDLTMRCESASLPGVAIRTTMINKYGIGNYEKYAYSADFTDIELTFLCDKNSEIYIFWYAWANLIANFADSKEFFGTTTRQYTMNYKDDYVAPIIVNKYSDTGEKILTCNINRAYPIAINEMQLNWRDTEKTRLSVRITFKDWYIEGMSVATQ